MFLPKEQRKGQTDTGFIKRITREEKEDNKK